MIDSLTQKPIQVGDDDDAGPYIVVLLDQLGLVTKLLDEAGYHYDVDEEALSINKGPYTTIVNLGRHADARAVQKLLDDNQDPRTAPARKSTSGRRR
jgi:hypothetical protein